MKSLQSKVFIVTGALGGIGSVAARVLAEAGANVVVTDVVANGGSELAQSIGAAGAEASFFAADLVDEDQVIALTEHALERFGRLDGAFNNAGVGQSGALLVDITSADFDRIMRINTLGMFHCIKHQMRRMKDGGSIVLTSSGLGVTALPHRAEYVASKHAVCGLARAAAVEGAQINIRVNALLPGSIRTPATLALLGPGAEARAGKIHLIERLGEPEEVAYAARWLLSDESSFTTGALIPVEGGSTAGRRP